MSERWDDPRSQRGRTDALVNEGDLVLRSLRALPRPGIDPSEHRRIQARATVEFRHTAARHERRVQNALRLARPLLPISVASFALGYLIWAFGIITL